MKTLLRIGFVALLILGVFNGLADANAPAGRYTTSAGTVYDTKTKLTWQQTSSSTTYALVGGAAAAYCASLGSTLGGSGWRVPTVKEFLTIIDYSVAANPQPAHGPSVFMDPVFLFQLTGAPPPVFWSSTAIAGLPTSAWSVNILMGVTQPDSTNISYQVRCVR